MFFHSVHQPRGRYDTNGLFLTQLVLYCVTKHTHTEGSQFPSAMNSFSITPDISGTSSWAAQTCECVTVKPGAVKNATLTKADCPKMPAPSPAVWIRLAVYCSVLFKGHRCHRSPLGSVDSLLAPHGEADHPAELLPAVHHCPFGVIEWHRRPSDLLHLLHRIATGTEKLRAAGRTWGHKDGGSADWESTKTPTKRVDT